MKKLMLAAVCVFVQAAVLLFCEALAENSYAISAVYHESEQALTVEMDFTYTNETGQALKSVCFNVYANVFRRESTLPYDNVTLEKAFPFGYAPSGIEFTSVSFNGAPAKYRFQGANECYMDVSCALEPGESGAFHFEYALLLSQNRAFQGCGEDLRLTLFYPSACVWDNGFVLEPTSRAAAFLYADKSSFDVRLYMPEGYRLATGAQFERISRENGYDLYELNLTRANELAVLASRRYYTYERQLPSGLSIRVNGSERSLCKKALEQAISAAASLEEMFGDLPFTKIDVAFSACCADSALPGLIVLDESNDELDALRIAYLMAQEYFGCAITSDPQLDPFLRYGVSCYTALLTQKQSAGEEAFTAALIKYVQPALKMTIPGSLTPDSALSRFNTVYDFEVVVKLRGAAVMHELCLSLSQESFIEGLRRYYSENQTGQANIEKFVAALDGGREGTIGKALVAWLMTIDEYVQQEGGIYR